MIFHKDVRSVFPSFLGFDDFVVSKRMYQRFRDLRVFAGSVHVSRCYRPVFFGYRVVGPPSLSNCNCHVRRSGHAPPAQFALTQYMYCCSCPILGSWPLVDPTNVAQTHTVLPISCSRTSLAVCAWFRILHMPDWWKTTAGKKKHQPQENFRQIMLQIHQGCTDRVPCFSFTTLRIPLPSPF